MPSHDYTSHPADLDPPEPVENLVDERVPAPPPPPKPSKVSKEDRLELENLSVKIQNVGLQLQIMQSDLQKALGNRDALVGQMQKKRDEMREKYGIDVAKVNIADDGTVTPHNIKLPGMP